MPGRTKRAKDGLEIFFIDKVIMVVVNQIERLQIPQTQKRKKKVRNRNSIYSMLYTLPFPHEFEYA